jgi:hypothetical protein
MVVLFRSQQATGKWGKSGVYGVPKRNWYFDNNFLDPNKLPPLVPSVRAVIRGKWNMATPAT